MVRRDGKEPPSLLTPSSQAQRVADGAVAIELPRTSWSSGKCYITLGTMPLGTAYHCTIHTIVAVLEEPPFSPFLPPVLFSVNG